MRWEREPVSVRDALALLFASGKNLDIGAIFLHLSKFGEGPTHWPRPGD
jgi:hypothetical protein